MPLALEVALGVVGSCLLMAGLEYAVHRWAMHRRVPGAAGREMFEAHAVMHHGRYYRAAFDHDDDPAAGVINIRMAAAEHAAYSLVLAAPLWLWLSAPAAVALVAVVWLHATVWSAVHTEMHRPAGRWFSRTRYYRYLRDFHHAHHLHPGRNFAIVFPPVMDRLFGTYHPPAPVGGA